MVAFHARSVSFLHLFSSSASLRLTTTIDCEKKKSQMGSSAAGFYLLSTIDRSVLELQHGSCPSFFLSFFFPSIFGRLR